MLSTEDGGSIYGRLHGQGEAGIVLAHGGQFDAASWTLQAQALARLGFRVLAIDFRGYGRSTGPGQDDPLAAPLYWDVLAAVRYLRANGARSVSVVGASLGGGAAGDASIRSEEGEIDRLVFLASPASWHGGPLSAVKGRKLFIVARDDRDGSGNLRLDRIRKDYEQVSEPKRLIAADGSAHAQRLFEADQGDRVMAYIIEFLSAP